MRKKTVIENLLLILPESEEYTKMTMTIKKLSYYSIKIL
jgi:hypothetical protein